MARTQQDEATFALRRAEVVDAAAALLAERDVDGVSMRAIAASIGQSRMTPYHYFQNKEQILGAVRAHSFRRLTDYLDEASDGIDSLSSVCALRCSPSSILVLPSRIVTG